MKLEGMRAVVTGAARGIGRGIAVELARAGCDVAIGDLLETADVAADAKATTEAVEGHGRRALAISCDVSSESDCERLVAAAVEAYGGLDILVCNAGIMQVGGALDITAEQWRRVLDVNLTGTFLSCQAALPHLTAAGRGSIVNIASVTGLRTGSGRVAYSSSKFGVVGLTQALAAEFAPQRVRVNCVCPSLVRSAMTLNELMERTGITDPAKADTVWTNFTNESAKLGRSVEPDDIGRAVIWLCESEMVSGVSLPVTGGDDLPG